jgi:hypothetical protein
LDPGRSFHVLRTASHEHLQSPFEAQPLTNVIEGGVRVRVKDGMRSRAHPSPSLPFRQNGGPRRRLQCAPRCFDFCFLSQCCVLRGCHVLSDVTIHRPPLFAVSILSPPNMAPPADGGESSPMDQDTPGPTRANEPARIRRNTACVRCRDAKVRGSPPLSHSLPLPPLSSRLLLSPGGRMHLS